MNITSRNDLVTRTLENLRYIDDHKSQDGPFEVTQLVNSFLLIVLQNWDDLESDWHHLKHGGVDWPPIQTSEPNMRPQSCINKIRDALAHGCFTFEGDGQGEIRILHLWTCVNGMTVDWDAQITVEQMNQMLKCFAGLAIAKQLRGIDKKKKGDSCDRSSRRKQVETDKISFRSREFKGSRNRCLLVTSQPREKVASFFSQISPRNFSIAKTDSWGPCGYGQPDEPKLGETKSLLNDNDRKIVTDWWLAKPGRANTPNWDMVSTCQYEGHKGIILVEAKSHEGEFEGDCCGAKDRDNLKRIQDALKEATDGWNQLLNGFSLSAEKYYQLSNRFALAWKLAMMGIPVVLVYLGFLNAWDMDDGKRKLLTSHDQWKDCLIAKLNGRVPEGVWDRTFDVNGTPLTVSICSASVEADVQVSFPGDHP